MADLEQEFAVATDGVTGPWIERFLRWGIPSKVIFGPRHLVGVGRIVTHSTGLFEFHEDGDLAVIAAEGEPEFPGWAEVHDLVAFAPDDPSRWWLRRGEVDLLGAYNMTPWRLSPTTIYSTPLSWLRVGADGVCIVDWNCDPADVLSVARELGAESEALKVKLKSRIVEVALGSFQITVASPGGGSEVRDAA